MAAETVHDLEHRFVVGGKVYIVQVCSPIPGSAAPESTGAFEVQIVTMAADDRADFEREDPRFLARRVVVDISTRMPEVPQDELLAFEDVVVDWIVQHRAAAAVPVQED